MKHFGSDMPKLGVLTGWTSSTPSNTMETSSPTCG